jgi:hypothetical protein
MRLAKIATAVAACSLAVSPALASSASKLSLSNAPRAATQVEESNEQAGGFIVPLLAVAAIVLGVVVAVDGDNEPDSN